MCFQSFVWVKYPRDSSCFSAIAARRPLRDINATLPTGGSLAEQMRTSSVKNGIPTRVKNIDGKDFMNRAHGKRKNLFADKK